MMDKPILGFIGAGKVGQTLARLFYYAGYPITAVHSRTFEHAAALAAQVGVVSVDNPNAVVERADLTLLTVPDDAIDLLADRLAVGDLSGKGIVHTSGTHDAQILRALAEHGAMTGSLHPAFPFADVESAMIQLPGSTFAVEAEADLLVVWLGDMVRALNGSILSIPPGGKALYHAALVIASNYTVTLYAAAEQLLLTLSDDRVAIDGALNVLVGATVMNLRRQGIPDALTGPLVRGDAGTIAAHLRALKDTNPDAAALYRQLAYLSLPMLWARGVATDLIEQVLNRT